MDRFLPADCGHRPGVGSLSARFQRAAVRVCPETSLGRGAAPHDAHLTFSATAALLRHLTDVPWLAKNVVWLVPSARCQALQAAEVQLPRLTARPLTRACPRLASPKE
jgi:hypothetical protein